MAEIKDKTSKNVEIYFFRYKKEKIKILTCEADEKRFVALCVNYSLVCEGNTRKRALELLGEVLVDFLNNSDVNSRDMVAQDMKKSMENYNEIFIEEFYVKLKELSERNIFLKFLFRPIKDKYVVKMYLDSRNFLDFHQNYAEYRRKLGNKIKFNKKLASSDQRNQIQFVREWVSYFLKFYYVDTKLKFPIQDQLNKAKSAA